MVIIAFGVDDHETYSEPECIGPFEDVPMAESYITEHRLRADPRIKVEIWPVMTGAEFAQSFERAAADFVAGRGTVRAAGERPC